MSISGSFSSATPDSGSDKDVSSKAPIKPHRQRTSSTGSSSPSSTPVKKEDVKTTDLVIQTKATEIFRHSPPLPKLKEHEVTVSPLPPPKLSDLKITESGSSTPINTSSPPMSPMGQNFPSPFRLSQGGDTKIEEPANPETLDASIEKLHREVEQTLAKKRELENSLSKLPADKKKEAESQIGSLVQDQKRLTALIASQEKEVINAEKLLLGLKSSTMNVKEANESNKANKIAYVEELTRELAGLASKKAQITRESEKIFEVLKDNPTMTARRRARLQDLKEDIDISIGKPNNKLEDVRKKITEFGAFIEKDNKYRNGLSKGEREKVRQMLYLNADVYARSLSASNQVSPACTHLLKNLSNLKSLKDVAELHNLLMRDATTNIYESTYAYIGEKVANPQHQKAVEAQVLKDNLLLDPKNLNASKAKLDRVIESLAPKK